MHGEAVCAAGGAVNGCPCSLPVSGLIRPLLFTSSALLLEAELFPACGFPSQAPAGARTWCGNCICAGKHCAWGWFPQAIARYR
eukprot:11782016-Heterocapsa_arctica.AAC.1